MIEHYNDILCIKANWLYEVAKIMSYDSYFKRVKRGKLNRTRHGGNGRSALIEYDSMPLNIKDKIIELIGNPYKAVKYNNFRKHLLPDRVAITFFSGYKKPNGHYLRTEKAKQYHQNAMFLNAIHIISQNASARRKTLGGRSVGIWENLTKITAELKEEFAHSLPGAEFRLRNVYKKYRADSYISLVHGNVGNQNTRKVTEKLEQLILAIYVRDNKPYPNMVNDVYKRFLNGDDTLFDKTTGEVFDRSDFMNSKGEFVNISDSIIRDYINSPKNRPLLDSLRNDFHYYNNSQRPHSHRHSPHFSGSKISLDDRDLPRVYSENSKGKLTTSRVKTYYAYDVTSHALIGVSYSKKKDAELFLDCLRNMFQFLHRHDVGMPMEMEVEHHLVSKFKNDLMKSGELFSHVHFCAAGNSQEKRAEHFNKEKKYGFEKRYHDGVGRFYLTEANRPKQSKRWDDDGMHAYNKKHTYDELVADDLWIQEQYNNGLHPNQVKYKGQSRMQVFLNNLNDSMVKYSEAKVAKFVGMSVKTSIRRNQYVVAFRDKFVLPTPAVMALLKPNNKTVVAYGLPNESGIINNVHLYQDENFIASCKQLQTYNEAIAERTETDNEIRTDQAKYIAKYDKIVRDARKELPKIEIIKNDFEELREPVEIHEPELVIKEVDEWDNYGSDNNYSDMAVTNL